MDMSSLRCFSLASFVDPRFTRLEPCGTAVRHNLEQRATHARPIVERIPGNVPVPRVSDDANDRQIAGLGGYVGAGEVIADHPAARYAAGDGIIDGLSTCLVQVNKDESIRNYHS
jgi:hypothetical protein